MILEPGRKRRPNRMVGVAWAIIIALSATSLFLVGAWIAEWLF